MGFWWCFEDGVLECGRWIDGFGLKFWLWWRIEDWMGWWWFARCGLVLRVQFRLSVGGFVPAYTRSGAAVVGDSLLVSCGRGWICGGFTNMVLILVSIFWLGSISPYSCELGLDFFAVSWLWCHSRG
jgi:hypothetical protein